jgi:hypothetical protein
VNRSQKRTFESTGDEKERNTPVRIRSDPDRLSFEIQASDSDAGVGLLI